MTTIAVTGGTGQLGRLAVAALKAKGAVPIALVRNPAKAADLGVETRAFDYTRADPAALKGVDTLVLISSNDFNDRAGQHRAVIEAAKAAGVGRIVYTSILKGTSSPMILAQDHIATEAALAESGVLHTILRNGWYTENYVAGIPAALQYGVLLGSAGQGRIASAARADYAEAAAAVLTQESQAGRIYELAGDESYTLGELADEIARKSGKAVAYQDLPEGEFKAALLGAGLPDFLATLLAESDEGASKGGLFDDGRQLSALIDRPTTPLAELVRLALGG